MNVMRFLALTVAMMAALLAPMPTAHAERLDWKACEALKSERAALEGKGVRGQMERGPEWAATNLSAAKLVTIRRYIEVDEQLKFRCHGVQRTVKYKGRNVAVPPLPVRKPQATQRRTENVSNNPAKKAGNTGKTAPVPLPRKKDTSANKAAKAAAEAAEAAARSARNAARAAGKKPQ